MVDVRSLWGVGMPPWLLLAVTVLIALLQIARAFVDFFG
jgi:hypothetical protein